MNPLLTVAEVEELTGLRQWAAQIRWLRKAGLTHYVRADGRPVVPSAALMTPSAQVIAMRPDFAAIRPAGVRS